MEVRKCKRCGEEKPLDEFEKYSKNGKVYYRWRCLDCKRLERLIYEREYRKKNSKKKSEINRRWAIRNKEKLYADRKEKRESDEVYKFAEYARTRIGKIFRRKGFTKSEYLETMLGCTGEEFYNHLLETYYKNYGEEYDGTQDVNIDHIIPLATAKTKEDVYNLFHYSNLQLLTATDNGKKWCKVSWNLEGQN